MNVPAESGALYPLTLFIDSADKEKVEPLLATGIFAGVTTNPTLLRRAGLGLDDTAEVYRWATDGGRRQVCFQVWGESAEEMMEHAVHLRTQAPTAVIKVPCSRAGATVIAELSRQGIPTLMTGVYSAQQMLVATGAGATYLAPYVNRMSLAGRDANAELARMCRMVPQTGAGPLVLAASIKSLDQLVDLACVGVRMFTLPPEVAADLFTDALTAAALAVFEDDMKAVLAERV
jgi:transaldolase